MKERSAITIHHQTDDKQDCPFVSSEEEGQQANAAYKQTNLKIHLGQSYHDYCKIPSKQTEYKSRLGVWQCREQFRMETFARGIPGDREKFCPTNNRPLHPDYATS